MSDYIEDTAEDLQIRKFGDSFFSPTQTGLSLSFGGATHIGKVRAQNEDHFAVFRLSRSADLVIGSLSREDFTLTQHDTYAMVVVDGMGGMKSGEFASRLALQTMIDLAGQASSWVMKLTDLNAQQISERVEAYVERIHATLQQQGRQDPATENMGTTWTSAHFLGDAAVVVHLGDSRAYRIRAGKLEQITRDETMAQAMIESGMKPSSVSGFGHILLNSFGGGNDNATASIYPVEFDAGDRLLLCSDGLTDMVSDEEIREVLVGVSEAQPACDQLIERALANGGRDNVTAVLAVAESGD